MALFSGSRCFGENQFSTTINECPFSQVTGIKYEDNITDIDKEGISHCYSKEKKSNAEIEHQLDFIEK